MRKYEFRLIDSLSEGSWVFISKIESNATFSENEIVNINGNPYVIHKIGSSFNDEDNCVYTYVDVFKAGCYKLKLNGNEF
jgi:hypothetical protein